MSIVTTEFAVGVATTLLASTVIAICVYSWRHLSVGLRERAVSRSIARSTSKHHESFRWLVERYGSDPASDLYVTQEVAVGTRLAFYSPANWNNGPYLVDSLLDFSNYDCVEIPIDRKVLIRFGKRIPMAHPDGSPWNDDILVARRVDPGPVVSLAHSSYFQFLSSGGALQLELEDAMRSQHHRTPRRDRLVPRTANFADGSLPLNPVGANVATVLLIPADGQRPKEARVLLQVRANNVAVSPGLHTVVPSFQILAPAHADDKFDLRNDLVREYLEELLAYDDVIYTAQRKQASSLWYLGEPPAERLMDGLESGVHEFHILGMGVDLVHAGLHLAGVLTIQSSRQELYELKANWEGRLFDIDLFSSEIDQLVEADSFQPDGAFAIDLARRHLLHLAPRTAAVIT